MVERKPLQRNLLVASLALLLAGAAVALLWSRYQQFLDTPLEIPAGGHVFVLAPGSTGFDIVRQLAEQGLTRQSWQWRALMRLEPHVYRSGEYLLTAGMLPRAGNS